MAHIVKPLVFLAFTVPLALAATHSLQFFYTAVTPGIKFPEFTAVGLVDGEPMNYYDSKIKKVIPKAEWMQKVDAGDPEYYHRQTQIIQGTQESFKASVATVMQRFNQTEGVHTWQLMYGCELHDDGTKTGYSQYGYDGADFVSLDLNTLTWTAANAKAVITKHKWDPNTGLNTNYKNYLENTCIEWLEKYVGYGRDTLERKVPPKVDLFQKDSSSPVVCHATGFFPKSVMISWQKNGEDLYEDVEIRETLPNPDGTFQKRSVLTVSSEELNRNEFSCVIQHGALEKEMVLPVINRRISGGGSDGGSFGIIGAVIGVLVVAFIGCIVGVVVWRRRKMNKPGFQAVPAKASASSDGDASSNNS